MKLVVGLGNPGDKYVNTRHNSGFVFVDTLHKTISKSEFLISKQNQILQFRHSKKFNADICMFEEIILVKPTTFMNDSGLTVSSLATYYKLQTTDIFVVFDDLDIALGEYKIQKGKGPKDHNGLNSIYKKLGTKDFWHIRLGVENRGEGIKIPGEDYVLMSFSDEEKQVIDSTIKKAIEDVRSQLVD